jgi:outer membrane protein OmpA-like peptidoglycan-associated protein
MGNKGMISPNTPGYRKNERGLARLSSTLSVRVAPMRVGIAAVMALGLLSGCSQGRGDWPTLASALGWGGDRVPAPDLVVGPADAIAVSGAPNPTAWVAPPPIPVNPVQPVVPYAYENSGDLVAQSYAQGLAATAPAISTATAGPSFVSPAAQALPAELSGMVPHVVLETYNDALSQSVAAAPNGMAANLGGEVADQVEYLDPVVIQFKRGSSRLSPNDKRRLGGLVKDYRSQGGTVYVIGHASSRTGNMGKSKHDLVNFEVSVDRANAVTGELLRQGVSADHMMMEARADRDPIYYEYMPSGEVGNQRVEIFLQ